MKKKIYCYEGGTKHNFQPRYSEQQRTGNFNLYYLTSEQARILTTLKIYEKDVCEWCGETIHKYD